MNDIVSLNSDLKKIDIRYAQSMREIAETLKIAEKSIRNNTKIIALEPHTTCGFGLFGLLSLAYTYHLPVQIRPDDFLYLIQTEITKIINENPKQYKNLFTDSDEKKTLMIPTGSVIDIDPEVVVKVLTSYIKFSPYSWINIFSTTDGNSIVAQYATLAESAGNYYNYVTYLCGIPSIKLLGTIDDWGSLFYHLKYNLKSIFKNTDVEKYLDSIFELLFNVCYNRDKEFWIDIFSQKNVGSGCDLSINGWIKNFYSEQPELPKIDNFKYNYSSINYKNEETNREFTQIIGPFKYIENPDGYWSVDFTKIIYEKIKTF